MEFPVDVALAELVPQLPTGPRWWYEAKLDGHRTVLWRLAETVRLQARSGRDVTTPWMDLAVAGMALSPGVVLDGEAVVVIDGRVSFEAAQARAASSPARSRKLAARHPALLITGVRASSRRGLKGTIEGCQQVRDRCSRHPST
ncbi:hypothetical protein ACFV4X_33430, partial [Streptomyces ardesiacus]